LMAFTNGVYDFTCGQFREGRPDDYITLSTNTPYHKTGAIHNFDVIKSEILEFMNQLFPDPQLCEYIWEHLSSVLVGINHNQTFNIYTGGGSNGKSLLVDLMSELLGDYKGVVPTTLITQKRNEIGKASPEIYQLIGRRYAVIQEPQKGDSLNEGIMKEITGGDPLQGRALFKDTVTFTPQFKLVVCTNNLMDIKSNDDGTWRRIRVCPFKSKFVDEPDYEADNPYLFLKNKNLKSEKFKLWVPVLMNMLIERVMKNKGIIEDCGEVVEASNQYRNEQDYISRFISEKIRHTDDTRASIKKRALGMLFKSWFTLVTGKAPNKLDELYAAFEKKYGIYDARKGWKNLKIEDDEEEDDDLVDN
jgi:P4 family phage/plasmid primase-like protien